MRVTPPPPPSHEITSRHLRLALEVHDERRVKRGDREAPLDPVEVEVQLHHTQLRFRETRARQARVAKRREHTNARAGELNNEGGI